MPEAIHDRIDCFQLRLYKLTTRSHLRIGAGEGSISLAAADNPVIQALFYTPPPNSDGVGATERVIYLPGSSLHGVIRAWSEKVQRTVNGDYLSQQELETALDQLESKYPGSRKLMRKKADNEIRDYLGIQKPADDNELLDDQTLYEHWRVHSTVCDPLSLSDQCQRFDPDEGQDDQTKQRWLDVIDRKVPCPICQVFGYVGQRGRIRVQHAFPAQGEVPLDIITRVAINRISGAADEGKLFDVEAVPPGAEFYFFMVLENMGERYPTVDSGIRALQLQLATLGAHSTVGFGTVDLEEVVRADLKTGLFTQSDLTARIKRLAAAQPLPAASTMDSRRYPTFYRALAAQGAQDTLGDLVTITVGAS